MCYSLPSIHSYVDLHSGTMDNTLVKERVKHQKCPYCGAERKELLCGNAEIDGKEAYHVVDCTLCEKHFTEVYSFCRVILTDHPGEDFRIDFDD